MSDDMLRISGATDISPWLLYDIFTHWLVAERKFFKKEVTIEIIRNNVYSWFPESTVRDLVLQLIADDIFAAAVVSSSNWAVTPPSRRYIRLNVGPIEVVAIKNDLLHLVIDAEGLDPVEVADIEWNPDGRDSLYPSVPGLKTIVNLSGDLIKEWMPKLLDRHARLIARASAARSGNSLWSKNHVPAIIEFLNEELKIDLPQPEYGTRKEDEDIRPQYSLEQCSKETGFELARLERWVKAINRKGQAIIYGPPGTGKTHIAKCLAEHLIGRGDGFVQKVQFHPAYSYEDFIQGIRPQLTSKGELDYQMVPGRFLSFCDMAGQHEGTCVLIIDEINRANLSRVFGELMYLLEYRNDETPLAGGGMLTIPSNVRIIGTMNTADRSIALVDHALRRRFAFLELRPEYGVLAQYHIRMNTGFRVERLIYELTRLNSEIGDLHYQIGISFFMREDLNESLPDVWQMEIEPYLQEYFFDQPGKVNAFAWDSIRGSLEG